MADRQVVWVPTAVTMQAYAGLPPGRGRSPDVARRTCDHQLEQLRLAREHGVAVAVGTDAGSPGVDHGEAYRQEMALLMAAGFPLLETVRCAAQNGARLLGTGAGVLKPGAPASFVAVDGPPSGLPGSLAHVRAVFVNGRAARRR
jgi:imidazolonepropionase-like amidohydrolase